MNCLSSDDLPKGHIVLVIVVEKPVLKLIEV